MLGTPTLPIGRREPLGVGLGFRAALAEELLAATSTNAQFIEIAPENYLGVGGKRGRLLAMAAERFPVVSHGLCGDFAGAAPPDTKILLELKRFLGGLGARWYSDHLCLTHVDGVETHDLLPLPFTEVAAARAAERIRLVQDILELPVAVENVSAYVRAPGGDLEEAAFLCRVVEQADCKILLDVNNVYVNAVNFGTDARAFIDAIPLDRVIQIHVAGHDEETLDDGQRLLIDTHGAPVADPVYALLEYALAKIGRAPPVLLERDHRIPPLATLDHELARLNDIVLRSAP